MRSFLITGALALYIAGWAPALAETPLEAPPPGKAVVYIGRTRAFVGGGRPFHFFEGENYLVRIKGRNYIRYVCEAGEKLFWATAENRSFVKAKLEAGHSYALNAELQAGAWSARVELIPITKESKIWAEFGEMIGEKKPTEIDADYVAEWRSKHPSYVAEALAQWRAAGEPSLELLADEFLE